MPTLETPGIMNKAKITTINLAISEARRFIQRAIEWKNLLNSFSVSGSKEGGAAKRASMDLTRVLAELRKS